MPLDLTDYSSGIEILLSYIPFICAIIPMEDNKLGYYKIISANKDGYLAVK